jgi:hypothetical protein
MGRRNAHRASAVATMANGATPRPPTRPSRLEPPVVKARFQGCAWLEDRAVAHAAVAKLGHVILLMMTAPAAFRRSTILSSSGTKSCTTEPTRS